MPIVAGKSGLRQEVPWCAIFLVLAALTCHLLVLVGNLATARAFNSMGKSIGGWSGVGTGLSDSLVGELNDIMVNVSDGLLDVLNETLSSQDMLETLLSAVGNALDSGSDDSAVLAQARQELGGHDAVAFVQEDQFYVAGHGFTEPRIHLSPLLVAALNLLTAHLQVTLEDLLQKLLDVLQPVLAKVGVWIVKFGDKITDLLTGFSASLDKVQSQLDSILKQIGGPAKGADIMLHETYTIFDVDNSGMVSVEDLTEVATLFSISALQGNQPKTLVEAYDMDGDGELNRKEVSHMAEDESVPNLMASVLRTYARKLSEVSAVVAQATLRSEVAEAVVRYFELVCAKNQTKVGWISDRLTNASLPLDFTADILGQMCIMKDDPDALTNKDIGAMVVERMMTFSESYVMDAFDLMSDPEHWSTEGFVPEQLPNCVGIVAGWIASATANTGSNMSASVFLREVLEKTPKERQYQERVLLDASGGISMLQTSTRTAVLTATAEKLARRKQAAYFEKRARQRQQCRQERFRSPSAQILLTHLLGGSAPGSKEAEDSNAAMALNKGVPAVPATLEFARFLSYNASDTANRFIGYCFDYTGETTQALDTFGTQVQAMVKRVTGFISMMEQFADPEGQEQLLDMFGEMASNAMKDLFEVVETKIGVVLTNSSKAIDKSIEGMLTDVETEIENTLASTVEGFIHQFLGKVLDPLADKLGVTVGDAIGKAMNMSDLGALIGDQISSALGGGLGDLTAHSIADLLAHSVRGMLDDGIGQLGDLLDDIEGKLGINASANASTSPALLTTLKTIHERYVHAKGPRHPVPDIISLAGSQRFGEEAQLSGIWDTIVTTLSTFTNVMPVAQQTLQTARSKVIGLAQNLFSIFDQVGTTATPLFSMVSKYYGMAWSAYFVFQTLLLVLMISYALWCCGFLGGDPYLKVQLPEEPDRPRTCAERLRCLYDACCCCWTTCHDTTICLWSCIITMQVLTLIVFLMSLVLCLLGAVKMMLITGCSRIYMLGDDIVCTDIMVLLNNFLSTFGVDNLPLNSICRERDLLFCDLIMRKMRTSTMLTMAGSFLAALVTLQFAVESAVLHERARWRRVYIQYEVDAASKKEPGTDG